MQRDVDATNKCKASECTKEIEELYKVFLAIL
jgi:hypothetical protein